LGAEPSFEVVGVSVICFTEGEYIGSSGLRLLLFLLEADASPSPGMVTCKLELRLELDRRWCKSMEDNEVLGGTENADGADDEVGGKADANGKGGKETDEADDETDDGTVEVLEAEVGPNVRLWPWVGEKTGGSEVRDVG
jgi:hypothetical protein